MGVYDCIKTEMPLPDDPKPPAVEWFQTKDPPELPCFAQWIIRADGRLFQPSVRYEDHSDKSLPSDDLRRLAGMMTPVSDQMLDRVFTDFHGDISFAHYDPTTGEHWDYIARFTDGVCTRIWCDEYDPPNILESQYRNERGI